MRGTQSCLRSRRYRVTVALCLFGTALAGAGPLKVDINNNGRKWTEGTDPAFQPWSTDYAWLSGNQTSAAFDGITVTFTRVGSNGTALRAGYWKNAVVDLGVKLVGDGLKVDNDDTGAAQIEMRIRGLSAGHHSLLTYHNDWDNHAAYTVAPLDVYLNGQLVVDDLAPTVRAMTALEAATVYLEFDVADGQDVVVRFAADTGAGAAKENVWINGFEIDTADLSTKALEPDPANEDTHVDADDGTVLLRWTPAAGAVAHDIYIGTDALRVENANRRSPEYRGSVAQPEFLLTEVSSLPTYYWRVDEIDGSGAVTQGDVWMFRARHLAFPGAEGYGRFARGGRGGVVVKVTNLDESGPGSFRDAIEGDYGPRTVIFDVGGLISLEDDIIITGDSPPITVAGQTAPGKGICVKRQQFALSGAEDAIVRFLRVRVGKESGETQNGSGMAGVDHCIMDHCSISWGIDEEMSTRNARNLTLQRTLIAEALNIAGHDKYPPGKAHGFAASIGGDIGSFHHNLLAHCAGRNWSLAGGLDGAGYYAGRLDIFNNVVYNWNYRTTDGGAHQVNFVNNYYKPGPASVVFTALNPEYDGFPGTQQYYMAGNVMPGHFDEHNQMAGTDPRGTPPYPLFVDEPFFESFATIHTARNAYKQVLSDVGCTLPRIDETDHRIIGETLNGTTTTVGSVSGLPGLPDTTADVGGWEDYPEAHRPAGWDRDDDGLPDWWERIQGLDPDSAPGDFSDSNGDPDGDEFTNLEDYLAWMAQPHVDCPAGGSVEIDLRSLSRGYLQTGPQFSIDEAANGTVILVAGHTARFTATTAGEALGHLTFTVADSQGDSMTRRVNVRIVSVD